MLDGETMLENILAGTTATGAPFLLLPAQAIPFTHDSTIRNLTIVAIELAAWIYGDLEDRRNEEFSLLARKIIAFARKGGTLCSYPSFLARVTSTTLFVRDKTELLLSNAGFAALATLAAEHEVYRRRPPRKPISVADEIDLMRAQIGRPPPPVILWRSVDRCYELFDLIHPFHIWEEGVRLDNCLACIDPRVRSTRIRGSDPAVLLDDLEFWQGVRRQVYAVLSLRSGTSIIATLGVYGNALTELHVQYQDEPSLAALMAELFAFLGQHFRGFSVTLNRPTPFQEALLEKVRAERWARLRAAAFRPPIQKSGGADEPQA